VLNTPFSAWPNYTDEEIEAVRRVLSSGRVNYWTGEECRRFEEEFAAWCGVPHAVSLANGTLALEAALQAGGVGAGDEVVVTPRTFVASASCVVGAGAVPVFADVDPASGNIAAETIASVLTPRTKAIICVHLAGWPCDMDPIMDLARQHDLFVIEDCAQAHGARYKGRPVGGIGHVGAWSFCQDKIMTTGGEGGMVTTSDCALWSRMWSLKDHGKDWGAVYRRKHAPGYRWLHESIGSNWRMIEVQAAIGRVQLRRMPEWTASRNAAMDAYVEACRPSGVVEVPHFGCGGERCDRTCSSRSGCIHAGYRFYMFVEPDRLSPGWSRDRIVQEILDRGVPCQHGSCSEVYLEKAFRDRGLGPTERLPIARRLGERSIALLAHPTLSTEEIGRTCEVLREVLSVAARSVVVVD
jgi:dTDP-4-amino-4,6-dideoxygalactose transaminase